MACGLGRHTHSMVRGLGGGAYVWSVALEEGDYNAVEKANVKGVVQAKERFHWYDWRASI